MKREDVLQQAVLPEPDLQTAAEQIESRRHKRFPISVSAEVIETKTRARVTGRATDLGIGGCYIDTLSTFSEGTAVEILLHWEGQTLRLQALVSYAVSGRSIGMGLAFTGTPTDQGSTLLDWVTGLGGEPAQEPPRAAEPQTASAGETKVTKEDRLKYVIEELVDLLVGKQLLSEAEGARFRARLSD